MAEKTFTVDWEDKAAISKIGSMIKSRLGELNSRDRPSKKERRQVIFDACSGIIETDTATHYTQLNMDTLPNYYVYVHQNPTKPIAGGIDPRTTFGAATLGLTHIPFYVGKGTGQRAFLLNRNQTHTKVRQALRENGQDALPLIVQDRLTEAQALALEDKLIDIFGLQIYGGMLTNLDEGYLPEERRAFYYSHYKILQNKPKRFTSSRGVDINTLSTR